MFSLTPESAELIGIHTGDGTLYKTNRKTLVWESRGHLEEKEYYVRNVTNLIKTVFDLEIPSKWRSGGYHGVWGIQTCNKFITQFFLDAGFKPGSKSRIITVPDYIWDADLRIQHAFIRGYFDTDGSFSCEKINRNILHTYPRVTFGTVCCKFRDQFNDLLKQLGFRTLIWTSCGSFHIGLKGNEQSHKWFKEITPHNTKHLKKYLFWKEHGFYEPFLDIRYLTRKPRSHSLVVP